MSEQLDQLTAAVEKWHETALTFIKCLEALRQLGLLKTIENVDEMIRAMKRHQTMLANRGNDPKLHAFSLAIEKALPAAHAFKSLLNQLPRRRLKYLPSGTILAD